MRIIGAGFAGLLAANVLRRHQPVIYERSLSLPSNHSAVLRFRSEGISRVTGIPFKKVSVSKAMCIEGDQLIQEPNLKYSNMYSQKVSGRITSRSTRDLAPVERWIAPMDFAQQMAKTCDIKFGINVDLCSWKFDEPLISTMPMPALMKQLSWNGIPHFDYHPIWVITAKIAQFHVDVYQTIYYPLPSEYIFRASITGDQLILEFIHDPNPTGSLEVSEKILTQIAADFGIDCQIFKNVESRVQHFGKIAPIDNMIRKNFIHHISEKFHIYSLGRYATWRQILLDDLVADVQFIENFIIQRDLYAAQKSTLK